MQLSNEQLLLIHQAIHTWDGVRARAVKINGQLYPLEITPRAGCRTVVINDVRYVEQNPQKNTQWAQMARQGRQITWAIPLQSNGGRWGRIVDATVEQRLESEDG